MSLAVHFLPWLRSGLGLGIGETEPEALPVHVVAAAVTGSVQIDGDRAEAMLSLRPPDHVTAIDAGQIARRYPAPNVPDAEYGYFPHIEFTAPDLPWVVSPSMADEGRSAKSSTGRLRPWLVLVAFDAALGSLTPAVGGVPQTLTVDADELPDLTESWAWAHVHSLVPPDEVATAVETPDGRVVARLICPRRLAPNRRYRAALVSAWTRGTDGSLHPAWTNGAGPVALRVFDTWTFTTGEVGSFEELAERLGPIGDDEIRFGTQWMDMTALGLLPAWEDAPPPIRAEYSGALLDAETVPEVLPVEAQKAFVEGVRTLIDEAGSRRDYARTGPDPVVSIPYYGSFATGAPSLVDSGWLGEINKSPNRRAAAGLGAEIVRRHQERFMAAAWQQAGAIREANRLLAQAVLRRGVGQAWKSKAIKLEPTQVMSALRPQLTFLKADSGVPVRETLRRSSVPDGTVSPAISRALRPSFTVIKSFTAPLRNVIRPGDEQNYLNRHVWRGLVENQLATRDGRAALGIDQVRQPDGMRTSDSRREAGAWTPTLPNPVFPGTGTGTDLDELKDTVAKNLSPNTVVRAQVEHRMPAVAAIMADSVDEAAPAKVQGGPVLTEALSQTLMEMSPDLLIPGIGGLPENSVHLLEADAAFAAALLAGANHEMVRELVWREYPAALDHTTFQRFWARPDPTVMDIDPMKDWDLILSLARLGVAGGESAVLLVRGDLLRQFPAARFLLLEPGKTEPQSPAFSGRIPPDVAFFGFDVPDKDAVTAPDSEWVVVVEEPAFEPRFGLDLAAAAGPLSTYSELSWEHLEGQTTDHLVLSVEPALEENAALMSEANWALNSAHMAKITHQKPFRLYFRAPDIIGSGS